MQVVRTLLALACLICVSPARAQDPSPNAPSAEIQADYYRVVGEAITEFDSGRFAEARALFRRAHELWPSARTWRTLGMTAFELRMYPQAQAELRASLEDPRRPLEATQRDQIKALLERTREYVGSFRFALSPPNATLMLDGSLVQLEPGAAVLLTVGRHELVVSAAGYHEQRVLLEVEGREEQTREVELRPIEALVSAPIAVTPTIAVVPSPAPSFEAPPAWPRRSAWIAVGIGGAGVLTAGVFGALAIAGRDALRCPEQACPQSQWDELDRTSRFARVSTAGLVIGVTGAAVASYLFVRTRRSALALGPLGVRGSF